MTTESTPAYRISCIIPVCDRVEYLQSAIDSASSQSVPPDEIIVVYNGSIEFDPNQYQSDLVKVYKILPYAGVAQAINFGSSLAIGEYLAFLEDDDLWNPDYLKNVREAIDRGHEYIVSRIDKLENDTITFYKCAKDKLNLEHLLVRNPGTNNSNCVISKKLFYQVGGLDTQLPQGADKSLAIEVVRNKANSIVLEDNQEIARFHGGPRLTKNKKLMRTNLLRFYFKYASLMNLNQKWQNIKKILLTYKAS